MNGTVIVWDLETVPDLRGFAAANGLVGKTDDEVREAIGDKFPEHIYHSIVCIGALVARAEDDHWAVDAARRLHELGLAPDFLPAQRAVSGACVAEECRPLALFLLQHEPCQLLDLPEAFGSHPDLFSPSSRYSRSAASSLRTAGA